MQRHNENGLAVAQYLEKHPKVKHVYYLGLTTHSQNSTAAKTMTVSIIHSLFLDLSLHINISALLIFVAYSMHKKAQQI